jgi:hypothetical protein
MFLKFRRCPRLFQLTCFASSCVGYSEARFVWSSGPNLTIGLPSTRSVKRQGYIPDGQMHGRAPTSRRARISSHTTEARRSCVWCPGLARRHPQQCDRRTDVVRDIVHHRMGILCPDAPPEARRGSPAGTFSFAPCLTLVRPYGARDLAY